MHIRRHLDPPAGALMYCPPDSAEVHEILLQWEATPPENATDLVRLLDALLPVTYERGGANRTHTLDNAFNLPATEGYDLTPAFLGGQRMKRVTPYLTMAAGAMPHLANKAIESLRTTEGSIAINQWASEVFRGGDHSGNGGSVTLRYLLALHCQYGVVLSKSEIKKGLPWIAEWPSLAIPLLEDPRRPIEFRADILMHLFSSTSSRQFAFFWTMGSPARGELLSHPPLRRTLWRKVYGAIAGRSFTVGGMLPIFNLLVATGDDRDLAPVVDMALRVNPANDPHAAAGWARALIGLEVVGRLDSLLPPGETFESAYSRLFLNDFDGSLHGRRLPPGTGAVASALAEVRLARLHQADRQTPVREGAATAGAPKTRIR